MNRARRKSIMATVGFLVTIWIFFGFFFLAQVNIMGPKLKGNPDSLSENVVEYTLPSLDNLIGSEDDLDVLRVLEDYKKNNDEKHAQGGSGRLRVIIVSTWRSGSTLLGEILSSLPGAFYHYEPLMPHGMVQIGSQDGITQVEVQNRLRAFLHCNYTNQESYLSFIYSNYDMIIRNTRFFKLCSGMPRYKCIIPENISLFCSLFPIHVMKVVRARLSVIAPLLDDTDTKVIWLTRDPRATMSSRKHSVDWCSTKICLDPSSLCSDLSDDYKTLLNLRTQKKQVHVVRYEDLATDFYKQTQNILNFLGVPMSQEVTRYLDDHLRSGVDEKEPWSTRHNPKLRVSLWRSVTSWEDVVKTQYVCRDVMKRLGYRPFDYEKDMKVSNAVTLLNLP